MRKLPAFRDVDSDGTEGVLEGEAYLTPIINLGTIYRRDVWAVFFYSLSVLLFFGR